MTIPLWVICDDVAYGPYSFLAARAKQEELRPSMIERCRDTAMVHSRTREEALQPGSPSWFPSVD